MVEGLPLGQARHISDKVHEFLRCFLSSFGGFIDKGIHGGSLWGCYIQLTGNVLFFGNMVLTDRDICQNLTSLFPYRPYPFGLHGGGTIRVVGRYLADLV